VLLKWKIAGSGSVVVAVIHLKKYMYRFIVVLIALSAVCGCQSVSAQADNDWLNSFATIRLDCYASQTGIQQ